MKKGIILYHSKYGSSEKYAKWLAENTGFALQKIKDAQIEEILSYDIIVFGGAIYASGISALRFYKKHRSMLVDKDLLLFCVGASPYDEQTFVELLQHNLPDEDLNAIPAFYCRGAWDESNMTFIDRTLCKLLYKSLQKKDKTSLAGWEEALLEAGGQVVDWTDRSYLTSLTELCLSKVKK